MHALHMFSGFHLAFILLFWVWVFLDPTWHPKQTYRPGSHGFWPPHPCLEWFVLHKFTPRTDPLNHLPESLRKGLLKVWHKGRSVILPALRHASSSQALPSRTFCRHVCGVVQPRLRQSIPRSIFRYASLSNVEEILAPNAAVDHQDADLSLTNRESLIFQTQAAIRMVRTLKFDIFKRKWG